MTVCENTEIAATIASLALMGVGCVSNQQTQPHHTNETHKGEILGSAHGYIFVIALVLSCYKKKTK